MMKVSIVKLVVRHVLAAVSEGHGDRSHAKRVHLVRPDHLSLRPDELFDVIRVGHYYFFAAVAVPQKCGLYLSQAVRRIVGVTVRVVNRVADKVKQHPRGDLVAKHVVPEGVVFPVKVESRGASKERRKRDPSIGRHQCAICGKNDLRRPTHALNPYLKQNDNACIKRFPIFCVGLC